MYVQLMSNSRDKVKRIGKASKDGAPSPEPRTYIMHLTSDEKQLIQAWRRIKDEKLKKIILALLKRLVVLINSPDREPAPAQRH